MIMHRIIPHLLVILTAFSLLAGCQLSEETTEVEMKNEQEIVRENKEQEEKKLTEYLEKQKKRILSLRGKEIRIRLQVGQLLLEVKAKLRHGKFTPWVVKNVEFTKRTAERYMKAAEEFEGVTLSDFTDAALRELHRSNSQVKKDCVKAALSKKAGSKDAKFDIGDVRKVEREIAAKNDKEFSGANGPRFNSAKADGISWCSWTWNPYTGCRHNCPYCYAESMSGRFKDRFPYGFTPHFRVERLKAPQNTPLPKDATFEDKLVFVGSMTDLFGNWVPGEHIRRIMKICEKATQWTFLFLTKNPARMVEFNWPTNCWAGATVDRQARVQATEHAFANVNAPVKFVSCEPLLEPVVFHNPALLDWIIIGPQTGADGIVQPEAEWVEALVRQGRENGCKIHFKPKLDFRPQEFPGV